MADRTKLPVKLKYDEKSVNMMFQKKYISLNRTHFLFNCIIWSIILLKNIYIRYFNENYDP